jgi:hypothetical protein
MSALVLTVWLAWGGALAPDTTLELRRGDRVVVEGVSGDLRVETWDRAALDIRGDGDDPIGVYASREGDRVVLRAADRKRRGFDVDAVLRVPDWVDLDVQGRSVDVRISGTAGSVQVRNVSGDIRTEDTRGALTLSSVEGEIVVFGARGSVTALSRGNDVRMRDVVGTVDAESGSADVLLRNVDAASVRAETLNGDLFFSGALAAGGSYWFSVHDGDADFELPGDVGAEVTVSTFDGEFTSDFPVVVQRYAGGGVFDFTLGNGGARLEIKVFDGEIELRRSEGR